MTTLQMFLSIAQNCIGTHEEVAIALSFMIIFNYVILDKGKAMTTLQMFLSIAQNCIETHEKVAIAVSFMIISNRFAICYFR